MNGSLLSSIHGSIRKKNHDTHPVQEDYYGYKKKGHLDLESNDDTVLLTHFNLNNKNMHWTKYNIRQKDNAIRFL